MWIFPAETEPLFVVTYDPTKPHLTGWLWDADRKYEHEKALASWEQADGEPDFPHYLIRSRSRAALEWCLDSRSRVKKQPLAAFNRWTIFDAEEASSGKADYRFRLLLPSEVFARLWMRLHRSIRYPSLKAETARLGDSDRYRMLEAVHLVVLDHSSATDA